MYVKFILLQEGHSFGFCFIPSAFFWSCLWLKSKSFSLCDDIFRRPKQLRINNVIRFSFCLQDLSAEQMYYTLILRTSQNQPLPLRWGQVLWKRCLETWEGQPSVSSAGRDQTPGSWNCFVFDRVVALYFTIRGCTINNSTVCQPHGFLFVFVFVPPTQPNQGTKKLSVIPGAHNQHTLPPYNRWI